MGRKSQKEEIRKSRKDQKIQKSQGNYKKLNNKGFRPPDLSRFKSGMVQSLKNKQTKREEIISRLESATGLEVEHLMGSHEEKIERDIASMNNNADQKIEIAENAGYLETQKYYSLMKKVIENCDIILEIIDARDPMACRCKEIQRKIQSLPDKKIVLILNKIDLIPMENAYAWQTYLRREFPVVMFKANMQNQSSNLSTFTLFKKSIANGTDMADTMLHTTKAIGADNLIQLIKQLSKVDGSNRAVTVGVIGYPNVGKSSVINSLKRAKTCEVSSIAGCTKSLKEIKLDSQVKLLDCPGIIFEKQLTKNQMILQNTSKADTDLEEVIAAILQRVPSSQILEVYSIEQYTGVIDFLAKICRKMGKLGKGGVPEIKQGAKLVIEDWNKGKLKYMTYPPFAEEHHKQSPTEQQMSIEN